MDVTCDFAAQSMHNRSSNLSRTKMLSMTDLMLFLPQVSCSAPESEDRLPKEHSFSIKKLIPDSENDTLFFYNLGAMHNSLVNRVEDLFKRSEKTEDLLKKMKSISEKTEEWQKKMDRKLILTNIAVGALAASCYGKQAWAKIKTLSANFKNFKW